MPNIESAGVAVVGQKIKLYIEDDHELQAQATVRFIPFWDDDDGKPVAGKGWTEPLSLRPAPLREGSTRKRAFEMDWTVALKGDPSIPRKSIELIYETEVKYVKPLHGMPTHTVRPKQKLTIGIVAVTHHPALTRIMLHEFARPAGRTFEFDPQSLESFVDGLSLEQRMLLHREDPAWPEQRMIVFVTLTAKNDLRMCADMFGGCMKPNAMFSVFHRDWTKKQVTLVCHTRHFAAVGGTAYKTPIGGKEPNEWLRKDNPNPAVFKILPVLPYGGFRNGTDGLVWHRIFTPDGKDVLSGNTLHGVINTHGCWMLFRNFNWPRSIQIELERIYREVHRTGRGKTAVLKELAAVGYDATQATALLSDSYDKFLLYDRNFAYIWFTHEIVGVKYFSDQLTYANRGVGTGSDLDPGRRINDYNTHGFTFESQFPLSKALPPNEPAPFADPDEGTNAYHDVDQRNAEDKRAGRTGFKADDSLLRKNALGVQTSRHFLTQISGDVTKAEVDRCAWADLFIYKDDGLDMKDHAAIYLVENTLDVHVVDREGHPLPGAEVFLSLGGKDRYATANQNGTARFIDIETGKATIFVMHPPLHEEERSVAIERGEGNRVTVRLDATARSSSEQITIAVRQRVGNAIRPLAGARVALSSRDGESLTTDAGGQVMLRGGVGDQSVVASADGFASERRALTIETTTSDDNAVGDAPARSNLPILLGPTVITDVVMEGFAFQGDHGLLYDNESDYSPRGRRYRLKRISGRFDWSPRVNAPPLPVSYSRGSVVSVMVQLGLRGKSAKPVRIRLTGSVLNAKKGDECLTFAKEFEVGVGPNTQINEVLTASSPLPDEVTVLDLRHIQWSAEINPPKGRKFDLGTSKGHTVFVTAGKPIDPSFTIEDGCTFHRMHAAMKTVKVLNTDTTQHMLADLVRRFPRYALEHAPGAPMSHPGYRDDKNGGAWLIADNIEKTAECQAIVRFMRAVALQLGYPGTIEMRMLYTTPGNPTKTFNEPLDPDGGLSTVKKPGLNGKEWQAVLIDSPVDDSAVQPNRLYAPGELGGLNAYEACLKVTAPGAPGTRYYAPGTGKAIFTDPDEIVRGSFHVLAWVELTGDADKPRPFYLRQIVHRYR